MAISLPTVIAQAVATILSGELLIGLTIAAASRATGRSAVRLERAAILVAAAVGGAGILGGALRQAFTAAAAYVGGAWALLRRPSLAAVGLALGVYFIMNPAKAEFRKSVWHAGAEEAMSLVDRLTVWTDALESFWLTDDEDEERRANRNLGSVDRMSQLNAVSHGFYYCPRFTPHREGKEWLYILTAPIPRFIWPNKPTTKETRSVYTRVFNRQSDRAKSNFVFPLLVDGWWNFGWGGVVFVTVLIGLWLGFATALFTVRHWALSAIGIYNLALVATYVRLGYTYGSLAQNVLGPVITCWGVYIVATLVTKRNVR